MCALFVKLCSRESLDTSWVKTRLHSRAAWYVHAWMTRKLTGIAKPYMRRSLLSICGGKAVLLDNTGVWACTQYLIMLLGLVQERTE